MNGYEWYCDDCGCMMNNQINFNTNSGEWTCTHCGCQNDVSPNNIEHYGMSPATEGQLRYISSIENILGIIFYGSSFEEASDYIDDYKDRYEEKLHTPYKYR